MVTRACAKSPTAGRLVRFVNKNERLGRTAGSNFEAMIRAVFTGLAKSESLYIEALLFWNLANRQHRPMEAAHAHIRRDFGRRPAFAFIGRVLDNLQLQSGRMFEADESLAKALLRAAVFDMVPIEMIHPEFRGSFGDRISRRLNLTRSRTALHALIRKGCVHRAWFGIRVGVIKMIVCVPAVKEHSLL